MPQKQQHPDVEACRAIAKQLGVEMVIIIGVSIENGKLNMLMYGRTKQDCVCAKSLGESAYDTVEKRIVNALKIVESTNSN